LLSRFEQLEELERSRSLIEGSTRKSVESASYPFGMRGTYNDETISILKDMGIRYACSNYPAYVTGRTDPYQLPRVVVRDMSGEDFLGFMRAITGGGRSHG
ncbi:MAG: polysaccharide deacetylase family protein, partial [Dehalococcoidales bacterium]|nr:polysaccharide deacetylase family protein [Dehalococcoidales bacterium]